MARRGPGRSRLTDTIPGTRIEGTRAVEHALLAGRRKVLKVMVSKVSSDATRRIVDLADWKGIPVDEVGQAKIDSMAETAAPRGVIARAEPIPLVQAGELVADPTNERALLVALDGVTDPRNLGAIMRSALASGATGILIPERRSAPLSPACLSAAAGAAEYLPIGVFDSLSKTIALLKRAGIWSVAIEETAPSLFGMELFTEPVALVFGDEYRGLSSQVKKVCDARGGIPLEGRVGSLNVSVAAGVTLFEVKRVRNGAR